MAKTKTERAVARVLKNRRRRESHVELPCVDYARDRGWLARKMNGLGFRDWPDRLFIPRPGRFGKRFWIEFKRAGEEPTPMQAKMHVSLRARGELVYVVDNIDDFIVIFHAHGGMPR